MAETTSAHIPACTPDDLLRWIMNQSRAAGVDAEAGRHDGDEVHSRVADKFGAQLLARLDAFQRELQRVAEECGHPELWESAAEVVRGKLMHYDELLAEHHARLADPRSNGTTIGHEPDVLPQGMTFHAGELGDAYVAGARDALDSANWPVTNAAIARACDAYVKHAHLTRLAAARRGEEDTALARIAVEMALDVCRKSIGELPDSADEVEIIVRGARDEYDRLQAQARLAARAAHPEEPQ